MQASHLIEGKYELAEWRLITDGFLDGPWNMAVDEAILEAVAAGNSPPTLRFYGWQPACLSLGYRQNWAVVDGEFCLSAGYDVVRRPTGGRAILHIDELTYSVCCQADEARVQGGVLESYQRLSAALMAGLDTLGLAPAKADPNSNVSSCAGAACFDGPSNYEIVVHDRKLIGSAQVRRHGVVLQHGTLPLYGDVTRIVQALRFQDAGEKQALVEQLNRKAITLQEALGRTVSFDEAVQAMQAGFEQALNLNFVKSTLTNGEKTRASELRAQKYASDQWTKRL